MYIQDLEFVTKMNKKYMHNNMYMYNYYCQIDLTTEQAMTAVSMHVRIYKYCITQCV